MSISNTNGLEAIMTKVTLTPMLDEEDGTPVFEVRDDNGNATNFTDLADALACVKRWTVPAKTLESMAQEWILAHGTNMPDDMRADVEEEFEIDFTDDQWDSFANMVSYCVITVEFPHGHGVPPSE
jgi:hypothetical protein